MTKYADNMPQVHNPKISTYAPHVIAGRISLASHLLESTLATRRRVTSLNEREATKLLSRMRKLDKAAKRHELRCERDMDVFRNRLELLENKLQQSSLDHGDPESKHSGSENKT